jgi:hypothetical protein
MVNLWAGYHHWNPSKVIGYNALVGWLSATIGLLPIAGPFALPIGMVIGGTVGAINSAIVYKIGSIVASIDKESNPALVHA